MSPRAKRISGFKNFRYPKKTFATKSAKLGSRGLAAGCLLCRQERTSWSRLSR
jgi:hypothetical protein